MDTETNTFAETYTQRSQFFRVLGEAAKLLADAYTQADAENQADIARLIHEALTHSLVEHHGYRRDEVATLAGAAR